MKYLIWFEQKGDIEYRTEPGKYGDSIVGWVTDIDKAYRFDLDKAVIAYQNTTRIITDRLKDGYQVCLGRDMRDIPEETPVETPKESWFDRLESN